MSQWTGFRTRAVAALLIAAFLACVLPLLLRETRTVLVLEDRTSGRQWRFVLEEDRFSLGFTHSVMKTPVEEFYRIDADGNLVMETAVYQSYGVGLPFLPEEGELIVEDGVFTLRMDRLIGQRLNMSVSDIPDHTLHVDGESWELTELLEGGRSLAVWGQRMRFWRFDARRTVFS